MGTAKRQCRFCEHRQAAILLHERYCEKNPERVRLPRPPLPAVIGVNASIKISMEELATLPPENIKAIMLGVAKVITACGQR